LWGPPASPPPRPRPRQQRKTRGEAMQVDLLGPAWEFWAATRDPTAAVRARIGLTA
jgi:hypothetical protein